MHVYAGTYKIARMYNREATSVPPAKNTFCHHTCSPVRRAFCARCPTVVTLISNAMYTRERYICICICIYLCIYLLEI